MTYKRERTFPKLKTKKKKSKIGIPRLRKKVRQTGRLVADVATANIMMGTARGLR